MHIVIVQTALSYLDSKTYNRQETGLAKALAKRGFKVSLIYSGRENNVVNVCENVNIYYLKCVKFNQQIGLYFNLWEKLDDLNPDLLQIHEMGMFMSFYSMMWTRSHKKKYVLIQGAYELTRKPIFKQLEWIFNKLLGVHILKNAAGIGCKTMAAQIFLQKYINRQCMITPVGLDVSRFEYTEHFLCDFREKVGIDKNKKVLLYIGVNEKRRHVDMLINTIRLLPNEYVLVLVGDGPNKKQQMERTKLETELGRIIWLNKRPQKELPAIYEAADLFLLATDYEIYGMVVMESMYYNIPVLATNIGGVSSIIENKETGYLIDSLVAKDWAERIIDIFSNKAKYTEIKQKLHNYIKDNLLWSTTCNSFIELYHYAASKEY